MKIETINNNENNLSVEVERNVSFTAFLLEDFTLACKNNVVQPRYNSYSLGTPIVFEQRSDDFFPKIPDLVHVVRCRRVRKKYRKLLQQK